MMRKKIFSARLFWDSFKQLRIIGVMSTVILAAFAAIIPVSQYLGDYKSVIMEDGVEKVFYSTSIVTAMDIQPLIVLTFIIIAPLLVLYIFHFLNKRSACDFYHSIPETRTCVFLSMFTACVAWIAVILCSSTAVSLITTAILHKYFIVNYITVFVSLFTVFCANILVMAATAAAMTITGTVFNNVFVTGMLLFVPRIFLYTVYSLVNDSIPFLETAVSGNIFFSPSANMAFGTLMAMFGGVNLSDMLYSISSGLYSLILGIVFAAAALFGFRRRKSEAAGNAAASKRLSAVYRITLASVLSLIPCAFIFDLMINHRPLDGETLFTLGVWYFIVVLAYALYELITSKKLKSMLRSLPGLLIVILANGLIMLTLFAYRSSLLSFAPKAEDVKSLNMISTENFYQSERNYILDRAAEIDITDAKAIQIVSESLAATTELYKEDPQGFSSKFYNNQNPMLVFRLNTGSRSGVRRITLTNEEYDYIMSVLEKNTEYKELFYQLPDKNVSLDFHSYSSLCSVQLTDTQIAELYALYLQDMQEIPLEQQIQNVSGSADAAYGEIELEFTSGFYSYTLHLAVTNAHTRTLDYLNQWIYVEYADNRLELIEQLRATDEPEEWDYLQMDAVDVVDGEGRRVVAFNGLYTLSQDQIPAVLKTLADYLETCPDRAPEAGEAYLDVMLDVPVEEVNDINGHYRSFTSYFCRFTLPENRLPAQLEACFEFADADGTAVIISQD